MTTRVQMRNAGARSNGFTLLEAIVLVALVVLLVVTSAVTAQQSGELARSVQCQSTLKVISNAMQLYADTEGGVFFHRAQHYNEPWINNVKLRGYLGFPEDQPAWTLPEELQCVSRPATQDVDAGPSTYGQNSTEAESKVSQEDLTTYVNIVRDDIVHPDQVVHLVDSTDWNVEGWGAEVNAHWKRYKEQGVADGGTTNVVAYRHDETANVAHFDGSVRNYTPDELYPRYEDESRALNLPAFRAIWRVRPGGEFESE